MATMSDVRTRLWDLIGKTIHLDWQLLTKRPENVLRMVPDEWLRDWPAHVWLGTSVEDQDAADKRIPELLKIPAGVRFLSVEPLLRPVDLSGLLLGIHWIICGAESGPHRRPCKIEWVESIVNQCCAAGVKCFVKQVSINGRVSKNPDEWPGNLRIREFPNALQGP
jgi:protein gp37